MVDGLAAASRLDGAGTPADQGRAAGLECLAAPDGMPRAAEGTAGKGAIAWTAVVPDDPDRLACLRARTRAVAWDGAPSLRLVVTGTGSTGPDHD